MSGSLGENWKHKIEKGMVVKMMDLGNDIMLGVCEVVLCIMAVGCLGTLKLGNVVFGFFLVMIVVVLELWRFSKTLNKRKNKVIR